MVRAVAPSSAWLIEDPTLKHPGVHLRRSEALPYSLMLAQAPLCRRPMNLLQCAPWLTIAREDPPRLMRDLRTAALCTAWPRPKGRHKSADVDEELGRDAVVHPLDGQLGGEAHGLGNSGPPRSPMTWAAYVAAGL